jgi:hypothetical protein
MTDLFSLGKLYVSDFLRPEEQPRAEPIELKLVMDDDTSIVHLSEAAPPELMWGRYWYRSGTNATMTAELASIVKSVQEIVPLEPGAMWVDIASNDGTLLAQIERPDIFRIGIDPADDTFRVQAQAHADLIIQEPFSLEAWDRSKYAGAQAKVVTCIAMFYDLADPKPFLDDVRKLLQDDGLFVLQMSYTPLMLHQMAFDNICHEHVRYYTLTTMVRVLNESGFTVLDCQLNDVNGGSFRVYAVKHEADHTKFGTQPFRDVCMFRVESILEHERVTRVNTPAVWMEFADRLHWLRRQVTKFVREIADDKTVWGYGASTKGNTLLQFFDLDYTVIDGIAERSPYKYGLRTVGTDIPIYSEEQMRAARPDYLLVLPWHFISEFVTRERAFLESGGKFIVPCPRFEVIGA